MTILTIHSSKSIYTRFIICMMFIASFGLMNVSFAQDEGNNNLEEIIITGSFIKRNPADSASPLSIIDRSVLDDQGVSNPIDFVKFLTINTGSEFNSDIFASGAGVGTAQYNLRGLGLASTLVLMNGRRNVLSGVGIGSNLSFIDINNLLPNIMIDRVEILKDGASTLYGSDAVAGVVNHITRDKYVGGDVRLEYRSGTADQDGYQLEALYGWETENTNYVLAASYIDQSGLLASETGFAEVSSGVGSPGSFFPQTRGGTTIGGPRADRLCGVVGGRPSSFPGGPGVCNFDLAPFTDVVPEDERFLAMFSIRHEMANGTEFFADFNYSKRETLRAGAPSFPGLTPISVPLNHPRVIAGDAPNFGDLPAPLGQLRYLGRPFGTGFDLVSSRLEDDYYRVSTGFRGDINDTWSFDVALTYGKGDHVSATTNDVLADVLQGSINNGSFNPFATAISGVAPNDPAVIDSIRADLVFDIDSTLTVLDAVVSRDLFELGGGTAGLALGAQYRKNEREKDYNDLANAERFYFLIGGPDTGGDVAATALFAELALPFTEWLEVQAALRYEDYNVNGIGDSVDPKIGVLIRPNDQWAIRGSYSTSYRAPLPAQLFESGVSVGAAFDPVAGSVIFAPVRTIGNQDLEPEQATNYNLGFTFAPNDTFSLSFDYWNFEYEDLITVQSATGIVIANLSNPSLGGVIRANGVLQEIQRTLINAPSLETDGIDLTANYNAQFDNGLTLGILASATQILNYDLIETPGTPALDLVGSRNYNNSGSATPELRANLTFVAEKGPVRGSLTARFIDEFENDTGANPGETIDSWTTYDAQLSINLSDLGLFSSSSFTPLITIGATNLTDEEPPEADTTNAFPIATRVHDPRGRSVYVKFGGEF